MLQKPDVLPTQGKSLIRMIIEVKNQYINIYIILYSLLLFSASNLLAEGGQDGPGGSGKKWKEVKA